MCYVVLIASILEEVGSSEEKKEKYKRVEVRDEGRNEENLQNNWEEGQKQK